MTPTRTWPPARPIAWPGAAPWRRAVLRTAGAAWKFSTAPGRRRNDAQRRLKLHDTTASRWTDQRRSPPHGSAATVEQGGLSHRHGAPKTQARAASEVQDGPCAGVPRRGQQLRRSYDALEAKAKGGGFPLPRGHAGGRTQRPGRAVWSCRPAPFCAEAAAGWATRGWLDTDSAWFRVDDTRRRSGRRVRPPRLDGAGRRDRRGRTSRPAWTALMRLRPPCNTRSLTTVT